MTPDKGKKPLPPSTSIIFPERPTTYQQWTITIQRVKILYLRGQWKQCSLRCCQLLLEASAPVRASSTSQHCLTIRQPQALHVTCLHFYRALSCEAMARLAHPQSATKLQSLEQAKTFYIAAASSLPVIDQNFNSDDTFDNNASSIYSSTSTESEILDYNQDSSPPSPRNDVSSYSSLESYSRSPHLIPDKPSPLRIRKSEFNQPSYTPPFSSNASRNFSHPTSTWFRISYYERYVADLAAFADMLDNHIATVNALIASTQANLAMRNSGKRQAAYEDDEVMEEADLEARVKRLKATEWKRERFRPEKYQELCKRALEEL